MSNATFYKGRAKDGGMDPGGCKSALAGKAAGGRHSGGSRDPTGATVPLPLQTSTCATVTSVGIPPGISHAGAGACAAPFEHDRQASFGRRVTMTRNWAGITSRPSLASVLEPMAANGSPSSPIRCRPSPQPQPVSSGPIPSSTHGRCLGSERRLAARGLETDEMREVRTICPCGKQATMVIRRGSDRRALHEGEQLQIGGNETDVALCRRHWRQAMAA